MTEKADIYSVGVLAVEIVCGKRSRAYIPGSTSLLQSVWKNYKAGNISASIDPALHGKLKIEEASNALQELYNVEQPKSSRTDSGPIRKVDSQILDLLKRRIRFVST
ncbi:hypothetical protein RJT34_16530 [Clitoria ternatea]|uniref:Protein kinase domain-containing protein n=1 Tax=Clitoria ternatea TaxID=43366 RepID=A0AAN9PCE1_CLITE